MLKKLKSTFVMLGECIRMSMSNILGNKVRSFLTILGIMIGVTAVIALITAIIIKSSKKKNWSRYLQSSVYNVSGAARVSNFRVAREDAQKSLALWPTTLSSCCLTSLLPELTLLPFKTSKTLWLT